MATTLAPPNGRLWRSGPALKGPASGFASWSRRSIWASGGDHADLVDECPPAICQLRGLWGDGLVHGHALPPDVEGMPFRWLGFFQKKNPHRAWILLDRTATTWQRQPGIFSHPIMPLANKSPWSSVGCFCNNRRLGFFLNAPRIIRKNKCQRKKHLKNTRLRTDSPPGYLRWLYLPDLEAPAVKNTQGWALLACWCFVTFVSPESSLNHLGCLWWQITKVRMGLARDQIQRHGIAGLLSLIIVQSCWGWSGSFPIRDRERW